MRGGWRSCLRESEVTSRETTPLTCDSTIQYNDPAVPSSPLQNIFEAVVDPKKGDFSAELAQHILGLQFTADEIERYESLAYRNQEGVLTRQELAELDAFVTANTFLMVLKSKARRSLRRRSPAA